jgi:isopentenyl diphosphate isomerase/L-lactate dehydrogenase-like FMN-dependent dehydrogenase
VPGGPAAAAKGVPFCLSTVSVCDVDEVSKASSAPIWFQLYVLRDRAFMRDLLARAAGRRRDALVFTVDMPVPGARYRDAHSGMSGPNAAARRMMQAMFKPDWAWDVGVMGRPHTLGNVAPVLGENSGLEDFMGWLGANFDPSIQWKDLEWIRDLWKGPLIIKGVLDPEDAKAAADIGADGIVVSNHGGRQLDGVLSSARALPAIAEAVGDRLTVLADSGVRSGLDVVRMLALGARACCWAGPGSMPWPRAARPGVDPAARPDREGDARGHGPDRGQQRGRDRPFDPGLSQRQKDDLGVDDEARSDGRPRGRLLGYPFSCFGRLRPADRPPRPGQPA